LSLKVKRNIDENEGSFGRENLRFMQPIAGGRIVDDQPAAGLAEIEEKPERYISKFMVGIRLQDKLLSFQFQP
jgi:hypothetical protein